MRIGIDISQAAFQGSGVGRYTHALVKALSKNKKNHELVLFGSSLRQFHVLQALADTVSAVGVTNKIIHLPPLFLNILWNAMHIVPIEVFIGQCDVFHSSDWIEPPAHCKKVTTIHDMIVYKYPEYLEKSIVHTQKAKLRWVAKESSKIITDSISSKKDIISYLHVPESKIEVIYPGIDDSFFPQDKEKIRSVLNKYKITQPYILAMGVDDPRKNFAKIKQAFLRNKLKQIQLVGIAKQVTEEESDSIRILTYVEESELPALYSGAEMFVYPSLYEGFGFPILEAMACGVPIITSKQGSLAEICGSHSITVAPDSEEEIRQAFTNVLALTSQEKSILIEKGIEYASGFTWDRCAQNTIKLYEACV